MGKLLKAAVVLIVLQAALMLGAWCFTPGCSIVLDSRVLGGESFYAVLHQVVPGDLAARQAKEELGL